tara:strand:+ start:1142 stop:3052 length:1911 start_codon:yes stop_codon:yes gene_type:complete
MATLTPAPKLQFFDSNGVPLSGGKVYTYAAGTTTPLTTYTSSAGNIANTNPIILDSRGEANVWLDNSFYKIALYSATDVLIWTVDNVSTPFVTLSQSDGSSYIGFMPSGAGAVATTVQAKLRQTASVFDFMTAAQQADVIAYGYTLDVTDAINAALAACVTLHFPPGGYKITKSVRFVLGNTLAQRVVFDSAIIKATGVVTNYDQIVSSSGNTGLYAMLNGYFGHGLTVDGVLRLQGEGIANIVGIGSSVANVSQGRGFADCFFNAWMFFDGCTWAIYAQTTVDGGSLSGIKFNFLNGNGSAGFMFLGTGNDDIEIDTARVQGQIQCLNTGLSIINFYTYGPDPSAGPLVSTGLSVGSSCSVTITHAFPEGNFDNPFVVSANASLKIDQLLPGGGAIYTTNNAYIFCNGNNPVVDVRVSRAEGTTGFVVARLTQTTWESSINVTCPYILDTTNTVKPQPFKLNVGGAAASAAGVMYANMTDGTWRGDWGGSTLVYRRVESLGALQSASVEIGASVALVTATAATVTSISLTPGDWDVAASVGFTGGATSVLSFIVGAISTTTNTLPSSYTDRVQEVYPAAFSPFATSSIGFAVPSVRISVSVTTTVYLVAYASFTTSTCSAFGRLNATAVNVATAL